MAEQFQRSKLYEYGANSNLVLEAERGGRREEAGSGEVESLHGKIGNVRMGELVNRERQLELNERLEKLKTKRDRVNEDDEKATKKKKDIFVSSKSLLSTTEELDSINYRPKTRDSRAAYEEILSTIQTSLGDQPQDILRGAAEEIISLLKDENLRDPDRIKEIEKIIPKISTDKISKLFNLGKRITDFHSGGGADKADEDDGAKMDEEMGVAVVFDDDDDDGPGDFDEINDTDDEADEEEGGVEAEGKGTLRGDGLDKGNDNHDPDLIPVHTIDAHWLQRQLSKYYPDANTSSRLAEEVLASLQVANERTCENRLVILLDFDKFDFIKILLKNRAKVYYCTRLKQAQSESDRKAIEAEMESDPTGAGVRILQEYQQQNSAESWARDRMGEAVTKARREAKALSSKSGNYLPLFLLRYLYLYFSTKGIST